MKKNYEKISNVRVNNKIPETYIPKIKEGDYQGGNIIRYFIQEAGNNKSPVFEISKIDYNKISNPYWKKVEIVWRIIGPLEDRWENNTYYPSVITSNRKAIDEASKTLPGIRYYLVNLKQFWKKI